MSKELKIEIPKTLRDIKLGEWQRYVDIYEKNKDNDNPDFLSLKMLQVFCGLELKDSYKIPIKSFDSILKHLSELFNEPKERVNHFSLIGTDKAELKLSLIPNLDKMTYGEWLDLEQYIFDDANLHRAMAVLYRPLAFKKGDRYAIHEYKGTDEMADIMKEMPVDIALGARVFFYRLARKLGTYITDFTLKELQKEKGNQSEVHSEENGEAINQYINSQMEKLKTLEKQLELEYTKL